MQVLYIHGEKEFMALSFPSNNAHLHFTFSCSPYIVDWLFNVHNVKCTGWEDVQCKMHRLRGDVLCQCALVDQSAVCTGWRETGFPVVDRGLGRGGREGEAAVGEGPAYREFRGNRSSVFLPSYLWTFFSETIFPTHNWEYEELDRGMGGQFEVGQYTHSYWGQAFHPTFWRQTSSERLIFGLNSS